MHERARSRSYHAGTLPLHVPRPPEPPGLADRLRALQGSAGNHAVSRMLQRSVKIGEPGSSHAVTYGTEQLAALQLALAGPHGALPAWAQAWIGPEVATLAASAVTYELDTAQDVIDWLLLERVLTGLQAFAANADTAGAAARGIDVKARYAQIEALRTEFAAAGEQNGSFTLCGVTYELQRGGTNHFYVTRRGQAKPVVYSGFRRSDAKAVLQHLEHRGRDAPYGNVAHLDNFVCSFLAEPTRWPLERVINVLAVTNEEGQGGGAQQMTGTGVAGTLPMAAGSTWEPQLQTIGRQVPKRALQHARSERLLDVITEALGQASSAQVLKVRVARRLGLIP